MELKKVFQIPEMKALLLSSAIGLEKENIRIHGDGNIAMTPHPFGDKAKHPFITTDFSESQVEIGTEVCSNPDQVYDQLENLHDIVTTTVAVENPEREYLWPMSNPPLIADPEAIPVAHFVGKNREKETYRDYLSQKYGKKIMLYCGIHYNFSFDRDLIRPQRGVAHINPCRGNNSVLRIEVQHFDAAERIDRDDVLVADHSVFVQIFSDTADCVAAHFAFGAVEVKHSHLGIGNI